MNFQVVVLAGGKSSRFYLFNQHHKSLNSLLGKPIITHTLSSISKAGFKEAILVCRPQDKDLMAQVAPKDIKLQIAIQPQSLGQANALLAAKNQINRPFFLLNSQHFLFHQEVTSLISHIAQHQPTGAALRQKTKTPEKYGILKLQNHRVISLTEKPNPNQAPSNWRLVGLYYFLPKFLSLLGKTKTQEYQLELAINQLAQNQQFYAFPTQIHHPSLKFPWDLLALKNLLLAESKSVVDPSAQIAKTATSDGPVIIGKNACIGDYALISGPAYIGPRTVVGAYSTVRKGTFLESGAQLQRYVDASNSILMENAHLHSGFVGDSIIGPGTSIGAGLITANRRLDRQTIQATVKSEKVSTGLSYLGAFVGAQSRLGIRISTMPATILGPNSTIYPSQTLTGTYPPRQTIKS